MALKNIKEIINNKGYVINPNDRKIFEEGDLQSFFGFSVNDAIEFIIYDVNDNQLPQLDGKLVRYIPLSTANINDYFLIPDGTEFQKFSLPSEYFIDVERLLNEAGYANGIFKTQITLINKRAGSDSEFDKLWVQEISPSRTEVRLLPLKKGIELNSELKQRYNIFVNGGDFREDTAQLAFQIVDQITPTEVELMIKQTYGAGWLKSFIEDFKVSDFNRLLTRIYESFVTSVTYEFTNRYSVIGTSNYGKLRGAKLSVELSRDKVIGIIKRILIQSIDYYLPQVDTQKKTKTSNDFVESVDTANDVIQTEQSDTVVTPKRVTLETIDIVKIDDPTTEVVINAELKKIVTKTPIKVIPSDDDFIDPRDPLGGVELDLNDPNEKALYDIVVDTYSQVNQESTKQFFEDLNNKSLEQGAPVEETRGQSTRGQSAGQGNSVSQVIDGKVKRRQINQI